MDTRYVFFAIISLLFRSLVGQDEATSPDEVDKLVTECKDNTNCTIATKTSDTTIQLCIAKIELFNDRTEISLGAISSKYVAIGFLNKKEDTSYEGFACAEGANYLFSKAAESTIPVLTDWPNDGILKVEVGSAGSKPYCKITLTQDVDLVEQTVEIGHIYYLNLFGGELDTTSGSNPVTNEGSEMLPNKYYLSSASTKAIAVTLIVTTIALINLL